MNIAGGEPAFVVDSDQQERRGADPRALPAGRHRHRGQQQRQRGGRGQQQQDEGRGRVQIVTETLTDHDGPYFKVAALEGIEAGRIWLLRLFPKKIDMVCEIQFYIKIEYIPFGFARMLGKIDAKYVFTDHWTIF